MMRLLKDFQVNAL
jgi:hypothetical protein